MDRAVRELLVRQAAAERYYRMELLHYARLELENMDMPDGYEDAVEACEERYRAMPPEILRHAFPGWPT